MTYTQAITLLEEISANLRDANLQGDKANIKFGKTSTGERLWTYLRDKEDWQGVAFLVGLKFRDGETAAFVISLTSTDSPQRARDKILSAISDYPDVCTMLSTDPRIAYPKREKE
jgi:hypothetical protein